jgi:aminoglycoside phosphotransferase (APT) family kinase protein
VLRIRRKARSNLGAIGRLKRFLDEIAGRLPFPTPRIEAIAPDGVTIETRLAGEPLSDVLPRLDENDRRRALLRYYETAAAIRAITMPDEPYGLLLAADRVTADTWPGFFLSSLDHHVARTRPYLEAAVGNVDALIVRARDLIAALPQTPDKVLAHGDMYPGNLLMDGDLNVTGLVDFGTWTLIAEPNYDVASAVMFAEIDDGCTKADCAWLRSLLVEDAGKDAIPAMTFYRAYFAFTLFDPDDDTGLYPKLLPWSIAALRALADGSLADWAIPRP